MSSAELSAPRPVVAAVDGSAKDEAVVRWAADEAAWRGADLLVLYAFDHVAPLPTAYAAGQRVTGAAQERAARRRPGLAVTTREVLGDATSALLDLTRGASMVVLGCRERGRLTSSVLGSVSRAVVSRGHGTVVVVTGRQELPEAPVTVWLDVGSETAAPLALALAEAARRGTTLRVVHPAAGQRPPESRRADTLLAAAREPFPGVPVEVVETPLDAVEALRDEGARSSLMVLGRPLRGPARGPDSVVQAVLHAAPAVAVVAAPAGGAGTAGGPAPRSAARG
ncbi:universal stress protein family protein [Georgenia soli]|uniref:Universal stress protein family protein n=1 Tax=Georgenia soli TaxID=638953 RepID=A0A2A9EK08_9MICO|nr:universal stress protein [Georgenia soli]PFG38592.1 universal stress protein family protein [Georgenia soli]